ncbi:MAG TPA: solute carrier family 23 protein [Xanthobacteraceae bacterium]|nr:solute carrier family 23 protein [Xanthobacteraceae bacterium]
MQSGATPSEKVFDIGIDQRLPSGQLLILGLQNIFGMTGMFVFPGILGRSFDLAPEQIAYLYGMTFLVSGFVTILQSTLLLRLPIIQGPYAGSFASLLAVGHLQGGGLAAAYGSFFVAALIWCVLTVPVFGRSVIGLLARFLRAPIIAGMIVIFIMVQVSNVALPGWIGLPQSSGFPAVNFGAGALAVAVIIAVSLWGGTVRRAAILIGLAVGTVCYALFRPVSLQAVIAAPLLVAPQLFPFGHAVQADLVVVFLLVLLPASIGSMALYQMVGDWGGQTVSSSRMSQGVFAIGLGGVVAGLIGGFSTIVYPDNIGMLRTTRVGSRYATLAAGVLLIVLGASIKFDLLLVVVPLPVLAAAATLLFGIVLMHGVHILAKVDWDDRKFIVAGLAMLVALGGMFIAPDVLAQMPLLVRLIATQPVISGGLTLVILHTLLCGAPPKGT